MPSSSNCLCPSRKFCPAKLGITLVLDVLELRVDHVTAHRGDRLTPRTWKENMSSILLDQAYTLERIKKMGDGRDGIKK